MLSVTVTGSGFDIGIAPELAASHLCHYGCQADWPLGIVGDIGLTMLPLFTSLAFEPLVSTRALPPMSGPKNSNTVRLTGQASFSLLYTGA
jgi:hypothetical protein